MAAPKNKTETSKVEETKVEEPKVEEVAEEKAPRELGAEFFAQSDHYAIHITDEKATIKPIGWVGPGGLEFPESRLDEIRDLIGKAY